MGIQEFLDVLMPNRHEAAAQSRCVFCDTVVREQDVAPVDWKEFLISGTCPTCFEELEDGE